MSFNLHDRKIIWNKFGKRCAYCRKKLLYKQMQVDHIIPKKWKRRGYLNLDRMDNLNPSCAHCNLYKRSRDLKGFRKLMSTLHLRFEAHFINQVGVDFGMVGIIPFDGKFHFEKYLNKK